MSGLGDLLRAAFPEAVVEVDLHGLGVPEALAAVERALNEVAGSGGGRIRLVCGKGRHSPGGRGVLREAVAGWLEARGFAGRYRRVLDADGLDGSLLVEVPSSQS